MEMSILVFCARPIVKRQLFTCPFSRACWQHLGINWRFDLNFHSMMEEAQDQFNNKFFMDIFIIGSWLIWKQRNAWIFSKIRPSFQGWKLGFIIEAYLQAVRMKEDKAEPSSDG
jgi:hypothetical protein